MIRVRVRRHGAAWSTKCSECGDVRTFESEHLARDWRVRHLQRSHVPDIGRMACALCGESIPDIPLIDDTARDAMTDKQRRTRQGAVKELMTHGRKHGYIVGGGNSV